MAEVDLPSSFVFPEAPEGLSPEIAQWLYANFLVLRRSVVGEVLFTTPYTIENDASEVILYSHDLNPAELAKGMIIKNTFYGWYTNASGADDFTVRVYLDDILTHSIARTGGHVTNQAWEGRYVLGVADDVGSGLLYDQAHYEDDFNTIKTPDIAGHVFTPGQPVNMKFTFQWDNAKAGNIFTFQFAERDYKHSFEGW